MNWFKCDDSGNILIDMHSILELLQNIAIPQLGTKQNEILEAIQRIPVSDDEEGSGGISASQLGEILQAIDNIPSQELLDNQAELLAKLTDNSTKLGNIESTVNDIKTTSLPEIKGNQTTVLNKITDNTDKLSNMNNMLDTIYSSLEYSVEGVLRTGETSITLEDEHIKEGISVEIYTSIYNVGPLSIEPIDGSITLTFPEQEEDMGVKVVFRRPIDWSNLPGGDTSSSSPNVTIDGVKYSGDLSLKLSTETIVRELPYRFHLGNAVVLNNEIHILGGTSEDDSISTLTKHYKYDGSSWTEVSTLPYGVARGNAVVLNNEIHILGGVNDGGSNIFSHYKYNGVEWVEVSTIPHDDIDYGYYSSACVYNNEIHMIIENHNYSKINHYKYNGTEWVEVSTSLPYTSHHVSIVYNDELHVLGCSCPDDVDLGSTNHYKYNGAEWVKVSTIPYSFSEGCAVVYNNEIHTLLDNSHYKYNGTEWVEVSTLPYWFVDTTGVVFNNEIHLLGGNVEDRNHIIVNRQIYQKC